MQLAFDATPRTRFLPLAARLFAGEDRPLSIGHGGTNSQPPTVCDMLRWLDRVVAVRAHAKAAEHG